MLPQGTVLFAAPHVGAQVHGPKVPSARQTCAPMRPLLQAQEALAPGVQLPAPWPPPHEDTNSARATTTVTTRLMVPSLSLPRFPRLVTALSVDAHGHVKLGIGSSRFARTDSRAK